MTAFGSVEIIDLSPESSTKASVMLPNYPLNVTGAVGTYLVAIDKAVVCGGTENLAGTFFSHCYEMDAQDREWTTSAPLGTMRSNAAGAMMADDRWWIVGGHNGEELLQTTEIRTDSGSLPYKDSLVLRESHHLVRVSPSEFVLVGGSNVQRNLFLFDTETEKWNRLPDIPVYNDFFQAGFVQYPNGTRQLVVAGGLHTSFSYGLDLDTLQWTTLPLLPQPISLGASVPYGDSFLIVGGFIQGGAEKTVYTFDPQLEDWILLPQKLQIGREQTAAFLVPDTFFPNNGLP